MEEMSGRQNAQLLAWMADVSCSMEVNIGGLGQITRMIEDGYHQGRHIWKHFPLPTGHVPPPT